MVEPTGSETLVFLRFGESEIVALFRERHDFKPGDMLTLQPARRTRSICSTRKPASDFEDFIA